MRNGIVPRQPLRPLVSLVRHAFVAIALSLLPGPVYAGLAVPTSNGDLVSLIVLALGG